nr:hypothetical protein [Paenibacillus terrae]
MVPLRFVSEVLGTSINTTTVQWNITC